METDAVSKNFTTFNRCVQMQRKFLATLTREIADEDLDDATRQMASIIFKNFILNRSKVSDFWLV